MRWLKCFLFVLILFGCKTMSVYAIDDIVPSNSFYFEGTDTIKSVSGEVQDDLFSKILSGKQDALIKDFKAMHDDKYTDCTVAGDLDGDINGWNYDANSLYNSIEGQYVYMRTATTEYKIYIPRGIKVENKNPVKVNSYIIDCSIKAIERYKNVVREGILVGSMGVSSNVFSFYSEKQVALQDVLEQAKDSKGAAQDYFSIKSNAGLVCTLDYFYNPIFGKIDIKDIPKTAKDWLAKQSSIKITPSSGKMVNVPIKDEFIKFVKRESDESLAITSIADTVVKKVEKVEGLKGSLGKTTAVPNNMVTTLMRVIVPTIYSLRDDKAYTIVSNDGYKLVDNVKLLVSHSKVYTKGKGASDFEDVGDYVTNGLDIGGMSIYYKEVAGKKVGAIVPLWYKEALLDTSASGAGQKLYTGREVKFNGAYDKSVSLDKGNANILGVDEFKEGGIKEITFREFAFSKGADVSKPDGHKELGTKPPTFELKYTFNNADGCPKGFVIIRNNKYANNQGLLTWLKSKTALSMSDIDAEGLYNRLTGVWDASKKVLSYSQWLKMRLLEKELHVGLKERLLSFSRVSCSVFGVLLIFYSIFLLIFYYLDLFLDFFDAGLLGIVTFGRLKAVGSLKDTQGMSSASGGVVYVDIFNVIKIIVTGIVIGLIFCNSSTVLQFILYCFYRIKNFGGL